MNWAIAAVLITALLVYGVIKCVQLYYKYNNTVIYDGRCKDQKKDADPEV